MTLRIKVGWWRAVGGIFTSDGSIHLVFGGLFLIYVNDIAQARRGVRLKLFAD